ncbi:unnamed protein product, partial [Meganyctiphanes norvegica]
MKISCNLNYIKSNIWVTNSDVKFWPLGWFNEIYISRPPNHTWINFLANLEAEIWHDSKSPVYYSIKSGNDEEAFAVNQLTGDIYLMTSLDYETKNLYDLLVVATTAGGSSATHLLIAIQDVNDEPPVFHKDLYSINITEEETIGLPRLLTTVSAVDGDLDQPQEIIYSLSGPGVDINNPENSRFLINETSGQIFLRKALDRDPPDGQPVWRLTAFGQDAKGTGLVGHTTVTVNLRDINDNAPVFPEEVYYGSVSEGSPAGQSVMTMNAEDADDSMEESHATLTYTIERNVMDGSKPIFNIGSESGVIKTIVCCLDREKTADYSIHVVAMDGGGLKGTGTASIKVKDINDQFPKFTEAEWEVDVTESEEVSQLDKAILTVAVKDEDETNTFFYKVIEDSGYGADKFQMDTNSDGTGSLKIKKVLDYEDPRQRKGFRFKIMVNDNGREINEHSHVDYAWINVNLLDSNDNKPSFENANKSVFKYEYAEIGSALETFTAHDSDNKGNSKVSYSIYSKSDPNRQFTIDKTGTVRLQRALDREKFDKHIINVLAIDDGDPPQTATATLTVNVGDFNDNAPKLVEGYRPILMENLTPRDIMQVEATDDDNAENGNGSPFYFQLDPSASNEILASFKVENINSGALGNGSAIVSSLLTFDREIQDEYHIPIIIKDAGTPQMIGTSTLTVIVGDENDNAMSSGTKDILVYTNYLQSSEIEVGRVYVNDSDDWDLPDKEFSWLSEPHPSFHLNIDTGMITMNRGTEEGKYFLKFKVNDHKHIHFDVLAEVIVTVKKVHDITVLNSGSLRIANIGDENFIRKSIGVNNKKVQSKINKLHKSLLKAIRVPSEVIDIFSVQLYQANPPIVDIRFSVRGSKEYNEIELNSVISENLIDIQLETGLNISMVGINECLYENNHCRGSCTNNFFITGQPYLVDANTTALVGIETKVIAECNCGSRTFLIKESCQPNPCHNGGKCYYTKSGIACKCPHKSDGPRCQKVSLTFRGDGYVWLPPIATCEQSHISLEFIATDRDGLMFYNGPVSNQKLGEHTITDYIALELNDGQLHFFIDFGSGSLMLKIISKFPLNDGHRHKVDIYWDTKIVDIIVDPCVEGDAMMYERRDTQTENYSKCQASGTMPPYNEYLNLNTPLQVGGLEKELPEPKLFGWHHSPIGRPFSGCIKKLMINSELIDLVGENILNNAEIGCSLQQSSCGNQSAVESDCSSGACSATVLAQKCQCGPGWTGQGCIEQTVPSFFGPESVVKYALSFKPDVYKTEISLRFRTWQPNGALFHISDVKKEKYFVVEIKNGYLQLRYNLKSERTQEHVLSLSVLSVNDGEWHLVRAKRDVSSAVLLLDGGEGRRYNETRPLSSHGLLDIGKQAFIFAGGVGEYTHSNTYSIINDFKQGCLDDIRLNGYQLPLPPSHNSSNWAQATVVHNVKEGCESSPQCVNITCLAPLICKELWMNHECGFPIIYMSQRMEDMIRCLSSIARTAIFNNSSNTIRLSCINNNVTGRDIKQIVFGCKSSMPIQHNFMTVLIVLPIYLKNNNNNTRKCMNDPCIKSCKRKKKITLYNLRLMLLTLWYLPFQRQRMHQYTNIFNLTVISIIKCMTSNDLQGNMCTKQIACWSNDLVITEQYFARRISVRLAKISVDKYGGLYCKMHNFVGWTKPVIDNNHYIREQQQNQDIDELRPIIDIVRRFYVGYSPGPPSDIRLKIYHFDREIQRVLSVSIFMYRVLVVGGRDTGFAFKSK